MPSQPLLDVAKQYFAGNFRPPDAHPLPAQAFQALCDQFFQNHDDWYRAFYDRRGMSVDPIKALLEVDIAMFQETYAHMPKCYVKCAISSGTNAHHDAVFKNHHTTDRLNEVVGEDWHRDRNIVPNSTRALQRSRELQPFLPGHLFITPPAFEGATRAVSKGKGREITGGNAFVGEHFMSFWNTVIDSCTAAILDDVKSDMPSIEQVLEEIREARGGAKPKWRHENLKTTDWGNSRNSNFEMYRQNIVRLGLHPLRPDAKMDMYLYDRETDALHFPTLSDCVKPVIQSVLRWAPQGVAVEEACRVVARVFSMHRMLTDPEYNAKQIVPLNLGKIDPRLANPAQAEVTEMNTLITAVEPFLLKYCPHLIRPAGLPDIYAQAKAGFILQEKDIGPASVAWQRHNIPGEEAAALWPLTMPAQRTPETALKKRQIFDPPQRMHDLTGSPFDEKWHSEMWEDNPFPHLPQMLKDLANGRIGVLETVLLPLGAPDFHTIVHDMKRGKVALDEAKKAGVDDLALLPGTLGRAFGLTVTEPNLKQAQAKLAELRGAEGETPSAVFGTPVIRDLDKNIRAVWKRFPGPGHEPDSNFRLALNMKMMDRNATVAWFQPGWETSEDDARMMLRATLIELGKVPRPSSVQDDMTPKNYDGAYISFHERYEKLRVYLETLGRNPRVTELAEKARGGDESESRAAMEKLEEYGIKHISLALARLMEIHDCYAEEPFNKGRFDFHKLRNVEAFKKDIEKVQSTKAATREDICDRWVWLWGRPQGGADDYAGLRDEYEQSWMKTHGAQAQDAGPPATHDQMQVRHPGALRRG